MLNTRSVRLFGILAAAAFVVSLAGCNTVRGAGDDLKGAANATEKAITGDEKK
jgi:predicted small secreted protein